MWGTHRQTGSCQRCCTRSRRRRPQRVAADTHFVCVCVCARGVGGRWRQLLMAIDAMRVTRIILHTAEARLKFISVRTALFLSPREHCALAACCRLGV
eukprot:691005-Rhodomonas_salina.1